jgi:CubicO group peptidase (beta-lactamase class C family)
VSGDPISTALLPFIEDGWSPGAAWLVMNRGQVVSRGAVGSARPETVYDLASLTKPLATATLALLAHGRGDLDLDAPWEQYLAEFRDSPWAGKTCSEVLRHLAGFPAWQALYLNAAPPLEQLRHVAPIVDRGRELYSDLGYLAFGLLLERIEGCPLDEAFQNRICEPLGISGLAFAPAGREEAAPTEQGNAYEAALAGQAGEGYSFRQSMIQGKVHDGNAFALGGVAGHAGLFGSVDPVAALALEWCTAERLPWGKAAPRRFHVLSGATYSEGWQAADGCAAARGVLPDRWRGHLGFTGCSVFVDPQSRSLAVLLSNRVHPTVQSRGFEEPRRAFHKAASQQMSSSKPVSRTNVTAVAERPSRFFAIALLVSVLLHGCLLLIAVYVPGLAEILTFRPEETVQEDTVVKFSFAPPAEQDSDGAARRAAEATPPIPPAPVPSVDLSATTPVPQGAVPAPSLPTPEEAEESREEVQEAEQRQEAEPDRATEKAQEAEEVDPRPDRETAPKPNESQNTESTPQPPSFNLGEALREFEGALNAAQAAQPRTGGVPVNVFRPDAAELPFAGFGVGNLEFGTRDYDWNDYGRQIYVAIWREWHKQLYYGVDEFERWAHQNQEWLAKARDKLEFVIESNGEVSRVTLLGGDGMDPLDDSTRRTLESVVLPPLPEDFPKDREIIRANFFLSGDLHTMRRSLEWMLKNGYFNIGRDYGPLAKPKERSR